MTPNGAEIEAWLVSSLATLLRIPADEIDVREPLATYGLRSAEALTLLTDLEDWLGTSVPATVVWDYPRIDALAGHLAQRVAG